MSDLAIGAINVGSPASGSLGWAIKSPGGALPELGQDLDAFVDPAAKLAEQCPLIVGFEVPTFAPYRGTAKAVLKVRQGGASI